MKLLIISEQESGLSRLLTACFDEADRLTPEEAAFADLSCYDCFALLCGTQAEPVFLRPALKRAIEAQLARGARVFAEYVCHLAGIDQVGSENTRYARPVLMDGGALGLSLEQGLLFEEQSNNRFFPRPANRSARPILQYFTNPRGFYTMENIQSAEPDEKRFALWLERGNLLVCAFRMQNFDAAKFSPQHAWAALISAIVRWLGGRCEETQVLSMMRAAYRMRGESCGVRETVQHAIGWFDRAGMLVDHGGEPYAVMEGLLAHVYPTGEHALAEQLRPDCAGEAALMYYLQHRLTGDQEALRRADGLARFPMDMQLADGPRAGWVGWTPSSPFACYQDDVARGFLLPELWRAHLSGDHSRLPRVQLTLDYLIATTGSNGLRMARTDFVREDDGRMTGFGISRNEDGKWSCKGFSCETSEIVNLPGSPSAHYNAYYLASLLLYAHLTGEEKYALAARRGLGAIMAEYPATAREHSETQELCRLILPLALLHWVDCTEEEKGWLYRITDDLTRFRHASGGYTEWDTGYIATCAGVKDGESSVLCENGDPVADLLYSLNWLPTGFAAAWMTTGDERFRTLLQEIAGFFARCQILSDDPRIDGAWPRSLDLDRFEVYGVPNDVGWAPWSVESGWTVAEIAGGLMLGMLCGAL